MTVVDTVHTDPAAESTGPAAGLLCVHCDRPVDITRNHVPDPPAHPYCAFQVRQEAQRAQWRAAQPTSDEERQLRDWLKRFTADGCAVTGPYLGDVAARHAERPRMGGGWDIPEWERPFKLPGPHLPWIEIAQTPCPGGEWMALADGPPYYADGFWCGHRHHHPGAGRMAVNQATGEVSYT